MCGGGGGGWVFGGCVCVWVHVGVCGCVCVRAHVASVVSSLGSLRGGFTQHVVGPVPTFSGMKADTMVPTGLAAVPTLTGCGWGC